MFFREINTFFVCFYQKLNYFFREITCISFDIFGSICSWTRISWTWRFHGFCINSWNATVNKKFIKKLFRYSRIFFKKFTKKIHLPITFFSIWFNRFLSIGSSCCSCSSTWFLNFIIQPLLSSSIDFKTWR